MDDKGEYSVEVQDKKPKHSKCKVKVIGVNELEYNKSFTSTILKFVYAISDPPSVFTEKVVEMLTPLKNIEAMEKDTVTFTCELSKPDRKDGKWKHLGKDITPKTKR